MTLEIETTVLVYLAHPVSPEPGSNETIESNLEEAKKWLKHLTEMMPNMCFVAPWITECEIWDDSVPAERAAGLARCHVVISRCDAFIAVGPRMSSGMAGEMGVAVAYGLATQDLTGKVRG